MISSEDQKIENEDTCEAKTLVFAKLKQYEIVEDVIQYIIQMYSI
jgi:hypothetical protein